MEERPKIVLLPFFHTLSFAHKRQPVQTDFILAMWMRLKFSWHGNWEGFHSLLKSTYTDPLSDIRQVHLQVMFLAPSPHELRWVILSPRNFNVWLRFFIFYFFSTEERLPLGCHARFFNFHMWWRANKCIWSCFTAALATVVQLPLYYPLLAQTPSVVFFSVEANCSRRLKRQAEAQTERLVLRHTGIIRFGHSIEPKVPPRPHPDFWGNTIIHWHKDTEQPTAGSNYRANRRGMYIMEFSPSSNMQSAIKHNWIQ